MDIIQQIGSYAGLAAVVGLAVLSALYFSMARDVKRLREWAGRAPERVAVPYQPPQRVVAQPVRQPTQPPAPPRPPVPPGATPVPQPAAPPAAAGAGPAVAPGPLAATPAAARAAGSAPAEAALQNTVAHPPPRPPPQSLPPRPTPPGLGGHFAREAQIARAREEAERADREGAVAHPDEDEAAGDHPGEDERTDVGHLPPEAQAPPPEQEAEEEDHEARDEEKPDSSFVAEESGAGGEEESHEFAGLPDPEVFHEGDDLLSDSDTGEQRAAAAPPPPPITATRTPLPPRTAPPPRSAQPPILPPYEQGRPGTAGWEERKLSRTTAALAVGGTVIVVAAAAFGVLQLTGEEDGPGEPGKTTTPAEDDAPAEKRPAKAAVDPRTVTVSVLNGTTVGGLAAKLGDKLEGQGFQLGNVTNNTDQQRAESVVLYAPGAEEEATDVSRRLKIDQREPIDPDSQTRAGDATVVVVAGLDLDK